MNPIAKYSIYGWMIGDAFGASFEFTKKGESHAKLEANDNFALGLVGGGVIDVHPGEFTDDTEMGLCILRVLKEKGEYVHADVAAAYYEWCNSNPKDIGIATRNALNGRTVSGMIQASKDKNSNSLSNGFLMRSAPLIVYYSTDIHKNNLELALKQDLALTHCNPELFELSKFYANILHLAVTTRDPKIVHDYAVNGSSSVQVPCNIDNSPGYPPDLFQIPGFGSSPMNLNENKAKSEMINAIRDAVRRNKSSFQWTTNGKTFTYDFNGIDGQYAGFAGYAIWLVVLSLTKYSNYKECMIWIASLGGDTDTNCCIVGAIMGALYPDTIPAPWFNSVLFGGDKVRQQKYKWSNPQVWMGLINN